MMQITIYTPAYNRKDWIQDCIESVAKQDYIAKRHLIVDDCSTDGTFEYVCSLLKNPQHKQVPEGASKFVMGLYKNSSLSIARLNKNFGVSEARNWAMRVSMEGTDIFGNLDSDDRYKSGYLSELVKPFKNPEIGVVYCDYESINHQTKTVVREFKEPFSRKRLIEDCLLCNNSLVRKSVLEEIGGYDPNLRVAEDWDLWLRIAKRYLIYHVPKCLLEIHTGNHGSAVNISTEEWQRSRQKVMMREMGQI